MSTNIIKIMEIMNHCEIEQIDGVLISFDFLKAFNTVEWQTIFHSLDLFGFSPEFIKMSKIV